ncbi:hypothetical protein EVAR_20018_1 [Eumeta japonica]|uniref:Uncharacterized protein n=1 Tax=Eumeta variegata TaxID=151549 RepID=A0A4C1V9H5_EUMVA|nr:hypothetical protein EVAR_20018_1 [Eumeta japonica]
MKAVISFELCVARPAARGGAGRGGAAAGRAVCARAPRLIKIAHSRGFDGDHSTPTAATYGRLRRYSDRVQNRRCSPDLAPCDFYLFPKIREIRGKWLTDAEKPVAPHEKAVETAKCECENCFFQWFHRMQQCIDLNGYYFEKQ